VSVKHTQYTLVALFTTMRTSHLSITKRILSVVQADLLLHMHDAHDG